MSGPRVVTVASQKGGVGKSSVAMLIADVLHQQGKSVLVVDTDPQRTAQKWESLRLEGYPPFPVRVESICGLREAEFGQWLEKRSQGVDYFIIDTPPNLASRELRASLYVSDLVILPFVAHSTSRDALDEVIPVLEEVADARGEKLSVKILLNKVDLRRSSERAIVENAASICPFPMMKNSLKNLAVYADAANYRTSFYALSPSRGAREALEAVVKEACK